MTSVLTEWPMTWTEASHVSTQPAPDVSVPDMTSLVIRVLTLLIISILALVGNCLVIVVILRFRKLRTPTNVFVCNLSTACFVIGVETSVLSANVIENRNALGDSGCEAWGLFALVAHIVIATSFALIAVSRYCLIGHPQLFNKLFSMKNCLIYSVGTWLVGIAMALSALAGWTEIVFNPKNRTCTFSRLTSPSFLFFYMMAFVGLPLFTSIVSYVLLFVTVRRSMNRTRTGPLRSSEGPTGGKDGGGGAVVSAARDQKDWKLTRMLIMTFLAYLGCFGPYGLVSMMDRQNRMSDVVYVAVTWILASVAAVSPIIYGAMNKNFRDAYLSVCLKPSKTHQVINIQTMS